jgi:hypothetical protein
MSLLDRATIVMLPSHNSPDHSCKFENRKGYAIATDELLHRTAKIRKREFMRRGINQHTLEKIGARVPVRAIKLAAVRKCWLNINLFESAATIGLLA